MRVALDAAQELRFKRLMEDLVLIDAHQHPMVLAADANEMPAYFRGNAYQWGFEAVEAGGWTAVATANLLSCLGKEPDASFSRFADLVDEISARPAAAKAIALKTFWMRNSAAESDSYPLSSTFLSVTSCTAWTCCTASACGSPA